MKPKTMILMVVAVACGLAASYMTSKLLAERNREKPEEETVPVLVAKTRIRGWEVIKDADKFEVKQYPKSVAPKKALTSFDDIKSQRLNKPIDEDKPIFQEDLLNKEQLNVAEQLLPGQRAIAIKVNSESLAGGFVSVGTRVDVLCTMRGQDASAKVVLQNMLVMAIDTQDTRNPEQKNLIGQTVTLAGSAEEAIRLALAQSLGELRLMLKQPGDTTPLGNLVVRPADLDKPIRSATTEPVTEEAATPTIPSATPTLPDLPPVEDKPEEKVAPAVVAPVAEAPAKPKKPERHVMSIMSGGSHEKAIFVKGNETEDEEGGTSNETDASTPRKDEKPAAKKDLARPGPIAPPAGRSGPVGRTRTPRQ